jgi:release factor glutamine methyltransferase
MNLNDLNEKNISILKEAEIKEAELEAFYIIEAVMNLSRSMFFLKKRDEVSEQDINKCLAIAQKRSQHMPLQYILGNQEFMGLQFKVTPDVLIPRQDTEGLVEEVLKLVKPGMKVLDMCTGSGCIAVSIAKFAQNVQVSAVDISPKALEVARENAAANQVQINFIESDMFTEIREKYDMIISNPPYIKSQVVTTLMPEVRDYEPHLALDGKEDGLFFYRKLANESGNFLTPGGMLCLEIGYDQGAEVAQLLQQQGFTQVRVEQDLCGLDRNVYGKLPE